jgi:hypothetical protein
MIKQAVHVLETARLSRFEQLRAKASHRAHQIPGRRQISNRLAADLSSSKLLICEFWLVAEAPPGNTYE